MPAPRAARRRARHLAGPRSARARAYLLRSALGRVRMYNMLPSSIVAAGGVRTFKRSLSELFRFASTRAWLAWGVFAANPFLAFRRIRDFSAWRPTA
eukprot:7852523-Pyramimonas_sp.AAC.1